MTESGDWLDEFRQWLAQQIVSASETAVTMRQQGYPADAIHEKRGYAEGLADALGQFEEMQAESLQVGLE